MLDREVLLQKIQETVDLGGDQILMQGGLHPELKLEWYEELLGDIKARFPQVNVHGFSPPEIHHFTKVRKLPLRTVLERLKAAGLGSLPGGGAEILVDRVRTAITRGKVLTDDWLERLPRLARAGRPRLGHDDVRPRRNVGRADRASGAAAAIAGRDGRIHGLHLLDVSARTHRHGPRAAGRLWFDPANALIDDFLTSRRGLAFDDNGMIAASGRVDPAALAILMGDPYFERPAPKSLDRNHFSARAACVKRLSDADGAATLSAFTVEIDRGGASACPAGADALAGRRRRTAEPEPHALS